MWLPLILLVYLTTAHSFLIPRLSRLRGKTLAETNTNRDIKTFYYKQVLDHFNYLPQSYRTFQQRYFINFKYWGGANSTAPIFVCFGGEAAIDSVPDTIGFMTENAEKFKALLVYIEHRYYGKSIPFKSKAKILKNIGYFSSAQALADYAQVLIYIKKTLQAENSPVIVIGGSYSGMLAAWFRMKYSHLAIGALASSAPILFMDDLIQPNAYYDVVSRNFKEASASCYNTIHSSWDEIDKIASQPNGLMILSERFNTCQTLNHSVELSDYLKSMYTEAAQFNIPPEYPVNKICNAIDQASFGNDILDKIYSGLVSFFGNQTCKDANPTYSSEIDMGWGWQRCSEMVIPDGTGNDTMFWPSPFNLNNFVKKCKKDYGVPPRPHWISSYYGGQNIKLVLRRVLTNLSKSLVAITTVNGSHCLDLMPSQQTDPKWLIEQRKKEVKIIKRWIKQYYNDLLSFRLYLKLLVPLAAELQNCLFHVLRFSSSPSAGTESVAGLQKQPVTTRICFCCACLVLDEADCE
ncbi:lysosomal Pro-X carboxypeptidase [Trifolium repens]|nr:lysosomal Pro-X carboxypeptidase [Trifolium repens]